MQRWPIRRAGPAAAGVDRDPGGGADRRAVPLRGADGEEVLARLDPVAGPVEPVPGDLEGARGARAELERAARLASWRGAAALRLAREC